MIRFTTINVQIKLNITKDLGFLEKEIVVIWKIVEDHVKMFNWTIQLNILTAGSLKYLTAGWGKCGCCRTFHPEPSRSCCTAGRSACWASGSLSSCCCTWLCGRLAREPAPGRRTLPPLPPSSRTPPLCRCHTASSLTLVLVRTELQKEIRQRNSMQFNRLYLNKCIFSTLKKSPRSPTHFGIDLNYN